MEKPTYGLIGRGRVATHMARYLKLEAQPFLSWHRGEGGDDPPAQDDCKAHGPWPGRKHRH